MSDINAASASSADVQTAINSATDGDRVLIPSGTPTWSSTVSWTDKNITVLGNGVANTVITVANSTKCFNVTMTGSTKGSWRISGIKFDGAPTGNPNIIGITSVGYTGVVKGWRIDNCDFHFTNNSSLRCAFIEGVTYGLFDHCNFTGNGFECVEPQAYVTSDLTGGSLLLGNYAQSLALNPGSDEAVYLEDCTINMTAINGANTVNDLVMGGRMVVRNCTITGAYFQTHSCRSYGGGSNGDRGARWVEIYNNTFAGNGNFRGFLIRSGSGVVYHNLISGFDSNSIYIDSQRCRSDAAANGFNVSYLFLPTGSNKYDGNIETVGNGAGYPAIDQIGRDGLTPSPTWDGQTSPFYVQPVYPIYAWSNGTTTYDGSVQIVSNDTSEPHASFVKASTSPHANGDYEFVNNGTTAKPGYTAYTYPHPLQGASLSAPIGWLKA